MGLVGLEPTTPALSRRCSNRLSYRPTGLESAIERIISLARALSTVLQQPIGCGCSIPKLFSRKEVIQPHLPIRLPCYDFTPVMNPAVVSALLAVRLPTSGRTRLPWCDGRCVQDPGTYSPRHADPRLLAIPTSCSRVADCNPDYDRLSGIGSTSRLGNPLYRPLYDV